MWLYIAMAGFTSLAAVSILDKFIVSEEAVSPLRYTFYSTAPLAVVLLGVFYNISLPNNFLDWGIIIITGLSYVLALLTMFIGYTKSAVSHTGPLIGAVIPLFVFGLSYKFLNEALSFKQEVAIVLLVAGSLIISIQKFGNHHGWSRGAWWGILAGIFFAIFQVGSKYTYGVVGFYSGLIWVWGIVGLGGLSLLLSKNLGAQLAKPAQALGSPKPHNAWAVILANKILSIAAIFLIQYAVSLGSVSVVNALSGLQFGILVVAVALLSKFFPNLFKETYQRGELIQEGIAVVVIALGMALLII